ncbi:Ldh family oxidoreductase [Yinghuangia aomiensis]
MLEALGASPQDAATVAALVEADLRGADSHGAHLLGLYVARVRAATSTPPRSRSWSTTGARRSCSTADSGFGQIAGFEAVRPLVERGREHGVAAVAVRESTHLGALARLSTERVARAGLDLPVFFRATGRPSCRRSAVSTQLFSTNLAVLRRVPAAAKPPIEVADAAPGDPPAAGNKLLSAKQRGDLRRSPTGGPTTSARRPTNGPADGRRGAEPPAVGPAGHKGLRARLPGR